MSFDRGLIVTEARSWIGTPYRKRGTIKGAGCDCGSLPGAVWRNCGLIPQEDFLEVMRQIAALKDDWFMHGADDLYTRLLSRFATRIGDESVYANLKVLAGNVILMRTGNSNKKNHAGIVTRWPLIVHCIYGGVSEVDASRDPMWAHEAISIFDAVREA